MTSGLQGLLSPRRVVGLQVTPGFIGAVQVVNALKGPEIGWISGRPVQEEDQRERELREISEQGDLRFDLLASCVSGAAAFVRQVSLPLRKPSKIQRVIQYQLEPHVPYPVDEMVVDFVVGDSGGPVTVVGVLKHRISEHLELLAKGDIHPDVVGLDDLALCSLFFQIDTPHAAGPTAIVHLEEDTLSFLVLDSDRLHFIRVTSPRPDPVAQLVNTWRLYEARSESVPITRLLLAGNKALNEGLPERISSQFQVPATWWRPFDHFRCRSGEPSEELQARLAVALGLALSAGRGLGKSINLRKEEFRLRVGADLRRPLLFGVCALTVLLGLFTFDVYREVHVLETRNEALRREISDLFANAFPDVTRIVRGQELFQMEQKIRERLSQFQGLGGGAERGTALDLLAELTQILKEVPEAMVENLSLDGREIRLDGQADSFEKVDRIRDLLSRSKAFDSVKMIGAKMDKRANAVKFNFSMGMK